MAKQNQDKVFSIRVDFASLHKDAADTNKELTKINANMKEMKKNGDEGSVTFAKTATKQRELKVALRETNKQIDNQKKENKAAKGSNDALRAELALLTKQYNALGKEQRNSVKGGKAMQKQMKSLSDELKSNESAVGDNRRNVGNYGDALQGVGGRMGGFISGMKGMTLAAKAFIATPLGLVILAIVGALAAVKAAFTSSEEGQNKFAKISGVISAILGNMVDLLADLGEAIIEVFENPRQALDDFGAAIKENMLNRFEGLMELLPQLGKAISLLFAGEFAEAGKVAADAVAKVGLGVEDFTDKIDSAIDAVKEFTAENIKEGEAAARVADMRAKADIVERNLLIERAKIESRIAELRLQAKEENTRSAAERQAALIEARELQDSLLSKEKEFLVLRRDAQILENTFSRTNKENKMAEAQAIAAVNQKEAERFNQARTIQRELIRVENEVERDRKEVAKSEQKRADDTNKIREDLRRAKLSDHEQELLQIDDRFDKLFLRAQELQLSEQELRTLELQLIEAHELELAAIEDKFRDEKAAKDKKAGETQIKLDDRIASAKLSGAQNLAGQVEGLAENAVGVQKAAGATSATISTFTAATAALQPPPIGAGPIIGTGIAAATVIAGLANVAKILTAEKGGIMKRFARGGASYMGVLGGNSHAGGGTKFWGEDGTRFEAEKGELIAVVNKRNTSMLNSLSDLNSFGGHGDAFAGRGGTFLQAGGFAERNISASFDPEIMTNVLSRALMNLPPAEVEIVEIISGIRNIKAVEERATG